MSVATDLPAPDQALAAKHRDLLELLDLLEQCLCQQCSSLQNLTTAGRYAKHGWHDKKEELVRETWWDHGLYWYQLS